MTDETATRRPIKTRNTKSAESIAAYLAGTGLKPNHVSILSALFACISGACLVFVPYASTPVTVALFIAAALGIQMRLLCNLFDGMIAIEGGFKTKSGEIFNDLPDRIADPVILICAGYSVSSIGWASEIGWLAGLLAVMTAYIRVLGGSTGASQHFMGPMAKQHRMAIITLALLISAASVKWALQDMVITSALCIVSAGCIITAARRTVTIVRELESQ